MIKVPKYEVEFSLGRMRYEVTAADEGEAVEVAMSNFHDDMMSNSREMVNDIIVEEVKEDG